MKIKMINKVYKEELKNIKIDESLAAVYIEYCLLGNKNTGTGDGDGDDDNPPAEGATIGEIVDENKTFTGGKTGSYNDPIIPKGFAPINEGDATWGTNDGTVCNSNKVLFSVMLLF